MSGVYTGLYRGMWVGLDADRLPPRPVLQRGLGLVAHAPYFARIGSLPRIHRQIEGSILKHNGSEPEALLDTHIYIHMYKYTCVCI